MKHARLRPKGAGAPGGPSKSQAMTSKAPGQRAHGMGSWTILPESWSGARLVNARDPLRGLGLNACAAVLGDVRWDRGSGPYGGVGQG